MTKRMASMRWGVWCDDPEAAFWLNALLQTSPRPSFVAVRTSPADDAVWHGVPGVEFVSDWQTLLVDRSLEAVFLAGTDDERLAAMRQLAEQDRPLWVWLDARHGLPFVYELGLIAQDRPGHLHGVWRHRCDPVLRSLKQQGAGTDLTHLEITRVIAAEDAAQDRATLMQQRLLADLDLVRWLGGIATRVTALRTTGPNGQLWKQSVLLQADAGPGISWSGEIASGATSSGRLLLRRESGDIVLTEADSSWQVASPTTLTPDTATAAAAPWPDVVRVFEWFDACEHSLERRRTIELHSEPVSERTVFKTQMTALGCGVLMATLLFALVYLAVGAMVPLPGWMLIALRTLVFAPLVFFLIAQLLLPLARSPSVKDPR